MSYQTYKNAVVFNGIHTVVRVGHQSSIGYFVCYNTFSVSLLCGLVFCMPTAAVTCHLSSSSLLLQTPSPTSGHTTSMSTLWTLSGRNGTTFSFMSCVKTRYECVARKLPHHRFHVAFSATLVSGHICEPDLPLPLGA